MTDAQTLAAAEKLSGCPFTKMMAYRRTSDGAVVINERGQKFRYTDQELLAASAALAVYAPVMPPTIERAYIGDAPYAEEDEPPRRRRKSRTAPDE